MSIIINVVVVLLIAFNIYNLKNVYKDVKELYKIHKERQTKRKKTKMKLQERKLNLNKTLQELKNIDLETPLYAEFTQAEMTYFLKVTQKLKEENTEIFIFASELLKHVKLENMRNFMKSAPFITIHQRPLEEAERSNGRIKVGSYILESKDVEIYLDSNNSTLYHELLHAASSDFTYNVSGFNIYLESGESLGKGLNEGYTELLNKRFFDKKSKSYIRLQKLAELIELFYENKEDMVTDYFNADIFGLVGELLKSMTLEEAIDIIVDIDGFLNSNLNTIDYLKLKQKILKLYEKSPVIINQNQKPMQKSKLLVKSLFNEK